MPNITVTVDQTAARIAAFQSADPLKTEKVLSTVKL